MPQREEAVPRGSIGSADDPTLEIHSVQQEHGSLQQASEHFETAERKRTAECLPQKTDNGSFERRGKWSQEEDEILIQVVNQHGAKDWHKIARDMPGRNRKQCWDRWMQHLDPAVNKQSWSEQEEITLIHAHRIHGDKWSELAKIFPGRTRKAIRHHWLGPMKTKTKSYLARGLQEKFPHLSYDPLVPKNSSSTSGQNSSFDIQVSPDSPGMPKSEQGVVEESGRANTLKGKASDSVHVRSVARFVSASQLVSEQVVGSDLPEVTQKTEILSPSSEDQMVANFPVSLQKEGAKNIPSYLKVSTNYADTDFSPALSFHSTNDKSDEIFSGADERSQELHPANLSDLLDMSYCERFMTILPDSPNEGNPKVNANFPRALQKGLIPAGNFPSSNDDSDEISSRVEPKMQEVHTTKLADLLDMSYCESLMIIPPSSPHDD